MAYGARRWIGTCLDDKKDMNVTLFRNDVPPEFVQYNSNELKKRDRSHGEIIATCLLFQWYMPAPLLIFCSHN